jgi:RNA polymerase sigma-54 factor
LELTAEGVLRLGTMLKPVLRDWEGNAEARISARNLVAAVEGRAATLLRIGAALVEFQLPRLLGKGPCRPLTMTALSAQLGLSKSTVSRAVAGVAMRTPDGTVHLRELLKTPVSPHNPDLDRDTVAKTLCNLGSEQDLFRQTR